MPRASLGGNPVKNVSAGYSSLRGDGGPSSLAAPILWVAALAGPAWVLSNFNYALFHSLAEIFSIVVTGVIFSIAWYARRFLASGYLLILGIASVFVGTLDTLHMLTWRGMSVFPGMDGNPPTQLWIASRSLQAVSFLVAAFFLKRRAKAAPVIAAYTVTTVLLLLSILVWKNFPVCFVEGKGLTPFKIGAEYVISAVFLAALVMMVRPTPSLPPNVKRLLAFFIVSTILAEVAFTTYVVVFGLGNLLGHLLKILAYLYLYQALVITGLKKPVNLLVRDLKLSEEALRRQRDLAEGIIEAAPMLIVLLTPEGRIVRSNPAMERLCGVSPGGAVGLDWFETLLVPGEREEARARFGRAAKGDPVKAEDATLLCRKGEEARVRLSYRRIPGPEGEEPSILLVGDGVAQGKR